MYFSKKIAMKKAILIYLFFFSFLDVFPQTGNAGYDSLVVKANSLYAAKQYKAAAHAYISAFQNLGGKALVEDRLHAAQAWSLAGYADSALYHLEYLVKKGKLRQREPVESDTSFRSLQTSVRWEKLLDTLNTLEAKLNKPLMKQLDTILVNDQKYRLLHDSMEAKYGNGSKEFSDFIVEYMRSDSLNLIAVKSILDTYGWLGPDEIGEEGNSTLFLVIQHSNLQTQEKYLPMMKEAVKNGKASPAELALLIDRVEMWNGRPQIYGSQLTGGPDGKLKFHEIIDEKNVNKRRAEVGLPPLEEYARYFGLEYKLPDK
jgi:hypothetical protein